MDEGKEKSAGMGASEREEIYSKAVRAGKRTYFFDVKATRRSDYYLTITESKKRYHNDGRFYYEKHKIFLYKEDFFKFFEGLNDVVEYIKDNSPAEIEDETTENDYNTLNSSYSNVDFEDLEGVETIIASKSEE